VNFARKKELMAVVIGVALAGVPVAAFNIWINYSIEQRGREEVAQVAWRALAFAERRATRIIDALAELAARGIDTCSAAHVAALRQANFSTIPIKELSIVDPAGQTLCTDLAIPLGIRKVVSTHPFSTQHDILIEVLRLGDRAEAMVRVRRVSTGSALAALVPAAFFLSEGATLMERASGLTRSIVTREGTLIAQAGEAPPNTDSHSGVFHASAQSDRYNLVATAALSRNVVVENYRHLRATGTIFTCVIGLAMIGFGLTIPSRRGANPVEEIELALKAGEFVPYFQPIIDIVSGKLRGGEVLIRWRKRDGSLVLPGAFIPLMESSGLIVEVTRALMQRARDEVGAAYGSRPDLRIGFNLAAAHFADETIVTDVTEIFEKSPIRLSQVVLEVTERQPLENLTETRRVIAALQGRGVAVAIDDVGAGHSGLSYLLKLGVDLIKIDKVFVDAIGTDPHSRTIIETLIDLARSMRMDVIAEGVENFEQVVLLRDLGIRAAQGYVFAPPLPASSFLQLVEAIDPLPRAEQPATAASAPEASTRSSAA
jgi:sensor c-di-GMP phosphodiesterase-like protein